MVAWLVSIKQGRFESVTPLNQNKMIKKATIKNIFALYKASKRLELKLGTDTYKSSNLFSICRNVILGHSCMLVIHKEIVGFQMTYQKNNTIWLDGGYVKSEFNGNQYHNKMIKFNLSFYKPNKRVLVTVNPSNYKSINSLKRIGFKPTKTVNMYNSIRVIYENNI